MLRNGVIVQGTQNLRQLVRSELARSTGAVRERCEADRFHEGTLGSERFRILATRASEAAQTDRCLDPMSNFDKAGVSANNGGTMKVGIIGGGTMGIGIAHRFAANGATTAIVDIDLGTAHAAVARTVETLRTAVERGKMSEVEGEVAIRNLTAVGSIEELGEGLDMIIEAVIEDFDLKTTVLVAAEKLSPVVLASNTSSISIDSLADGLETPDRFAGMHFFNPVWAMSLVEVIRGSKTSDQTLEAVGELVAFLGMQQAVINDAAGFATSRLGVLVGLEAIRMVEEGVAAPSEIDRAMSLGYRHPMGPLMLGDLVGLDVRLKIADHLASVYGERFTPPDLLRSMVASGRLGKKSQRGFYDWSSGSPRPIEEV